ncbi:MAG: hypothetical protein ACM3N9_08340, partial [Syntrophothermus sp.]
MKPSVYAYCIISILSIFLFVKPVSAQFGTIRGFVYEAETGEPVLFTNVYLEGTSYGAATDVNGFFT